MKEWEWNLELTQKIKSMGYKNTQEYLDSVAIFVESLQIDYPRKLIENKRALIRDAVTPKVLVETKSSINTFRDKIKSSLKSLDEKIGAHKELYIIGVPAGKDDIRQFDELKSTLLEYEALILDELNSKEEWFKPWGGLLKLIQITEDEVPITLSDIMEVVNCPEDQTIELITSMLSENPQFGTFDTSTKTYTKSKHAEIADYLKEALKIYDDMSEE